MNKSYVKTIEEENYILRQRVEEIDSQLKDAYKSLEEQEVQVQMSVNECVTEGIHDFITNTTGLYVCEDDAFAEIAEQMILRVRCEGNGKGYAYRYDMLQKHLDSPLLHKWYIDYWYCGLRFQRVAFILNKKKKYFIKCLNIWSDFYKNFRYIDEADKKRIDVYMRNRGDNIYKKKLYEYINTNSIKREFTRLK